MALERTFSIVKPDGVAKNLIGEVYRRFEKAGLKVVAAKMIRLRQDQAEGFYAVHRERPFFGELVEFMTSGPSVVLALEKENAQVAWRELMGPTDATKAPKGTIRGDFGASVQENATHGSDSPESAKREIASFFRPEELHEYKRIDEPWLRE